MLHVAPCYLGKGWASDGSNCYSKDKYPLFDSCINSTERIIQTINKSKKDVMGSFSDGSVFNISQNPKLADSFSKIDASAKDPTSMPKIGEGLVIAWTGKGDKPFNMHFGAILGFTDKGEYLISDISASSLMADETREVMMEIKAVLIKTPADFRGSDYLEKGFKVGILKIN